MNGVVIVGAEVQVGVEDVVVVGVGTAVEASVVAVAVPALVVVVFGMVIV